MLESLRIYNKGSTKTSTFNALSSLSEMHKAVEPYEYITLMMEQLVFSKYLLFLDPSNLEYQRFANHCKQNVKNITIERSHPQLELYLNGFRRLQRLVAEYTNNDIWYHEVLSVLKDPRYETSKQQLSLSFVEPFLLSLNSNTNLVRSSLSNVSIVYPKLYRDRTKLYVSYETETFLSYTPTKKMFNNKEKVLDYLNSFDWTGKKFEHVAGILGNLHSSYGHVPSSKTPQQVLQSMLLTTEQKKIKDTTQVIPSFMRLVNNLVAHKHLDSPNTNNIGEFLSTCNTYDDMSLQYLRVKTPSVNQQKSFNMFKELSFLEQYKHLAKDASFSKGLEADDPNSEDTDDDSVDPSDEGDNDGMNQENDTSDEDFGDDGMDDTTDDENFDDGMGDDGSVDSSDVGSSEPQEDNQPHEDELSIPFQVIIENPTTDVIMYRRRAANKIREILKEENSSLPSETITALRTWMSRWLYIASPTMTKKFLTLLLTHKSPIGGIS